MVFIGEREGVDPQRARGRAVRGPETSGQGGVESEEIEAAGEIDQVFRDSFREAGGFDVVINNAGSGHFGPAEFLSRDELLEQFQVVFFSHVRHRQKVEKRCNFPHRTWCKRQLSSAF